MSNPEELMQDIKQFKRRYNTRRFKFKSVVSMQDKAGVFLQKWIRCCADANNCEICKDAKQCQRAYDWLGNRGG